MTAVVLSTTTAASFATHRRIHVSRSCVVKGFAVSGSAATWSAAVRRSATTARGRRYQLIQTSCVYNFYVCTVVHTTAKIITITSVAHVAGPDAAAAAVQSATAAVHVVFSSPRVAPRLIRCPRATGQILVASAVVRQAAVAAVAVVRLLVVVGVAVRAHADVCRSVIALLLLMVMMRHRRRLLLLVIAAVMLLLWLVMLIMWHNCCILVVRGLASVSQQGGAALATATGLRLVV